MKPGRWSFNRSDILEDRSVNGIKGGPFTGSYGSIGGAYRVMERKLKPELFT